MSKKDIWGLLKGKGFSDIAAAALMGNMEAESNCEANRLQGDFTSDRRKSIAYTKEVDDGTVSEDEFVYSGPGGGGYGLCQWTYYSRKLGLYRLAKARGESVGSESVQIDWLVRELASGEYQNVLQVLNSSQSLRDCVDAVLKKFERPADTSERVSLLRTQYAQTFYDQYKGTGNTGTAEEVSGDSKDEKVSGDSKETSAEDVVEATPEEDNLDELAEELAIDMAGMLPKRLTENPEYVRKALLVVLNLKAILEILGEIDFA